MSTCAYRSLEPVLEQRLVELRERQAREAHPIRVTQRVAAKRIGRALGGAVMLAFGVASFACGVLSLLDDGAAQQGARGLATELLLAGWAVGIGVALVTRRVARVLLAARSGRPFALSGNPAADLAGLEAQDPLAVSRGRAQWWERASTALPLAAVSVSAPLTVHWLVWCVLTLASHGSIPPADFGEWIAYSALIVGHAHLVVLVGSVLWTRSLCSRPTALVRQDLGRHWGVTLLVATGIACVPGIVLLGIPPILVVATGLTFIPAMYGVTAYVVYRERLALEAAQSAL